MRSTSQRRTIAVVISVSAPPAPACFESRDRWVTYLESAQATRREGRLPFDGDKYRPTFNFCSDCSAEWRDRMATESRCKADEYVAKLTAGQPRVVEVQDA